MTNENGMSSIDRVDKAVNLEEADRIPICFLMDYYYANCAKITPWNYVMDDFNVAASAVEYTYNYHGGDLDLVHVPMGRIYSFYDPVPVAHSGYFSELNIPKDLGGSLQFKEEPVLDITDFRKIYEHGFSILWRKVPIPKIRQTQMEFMKIRKFINYWQDIKRVPIYTGSAMITPLETLSYLLGIKRFSRYIRTHKEDIKQMCEFMWRGMLATEKLLKRITNVKRAYLCLERVSSSFISPRLFDELVYPYIERFCKNNLKDGYTNLFHMDTDWGLVLERFNDLPKGKYILHLEMTDIFRAKKIVGDRMCLMGNISPTLQKIGSRNDIEKYVQRLIDEVAPGGGYLLGSGCEVASDAPPENIQLIIDYVKKHGIYRK